MIIYLITNDVNDKQYVGQTTQSLKRRWMEHIWNANKGSDYAIHRAIRKYGVEHFHVKEIDVANSRSELNDKEKYWIAKLNTMCPKGYNLVDGGATPTWTLTIREKVSGENHWTKRQSFTKEALQKKHDALYKKPSGRSRPIRCVETGEICEYAKEFHYKYGYQHSKILECCKGRRNSHRGLHWEFVER